MTGERRVFVAGGGIGGLAACAFMVRDAGVPGAAITLYESAPDVGGCLDAGGDPAAGYTMRGSRMMITETFECTWDLFRSIPSRSDPAVSVHDETMAFSERVPWDARARLIDRNRAVPDLRSMGFTMADRLALRRLSETPEAKLEGRRITDRMPPHFFDTAFWHMWQTTFAFQPWHSALEFRRYLRRFIRSFPRIDRLSGVKHPPLNHHDSMVVPLADWLRQQGVRIETGTALTGLGFGRVGEKLAVSALELSRGAVSQRVEVGPEDVVILQPGSMTDAASFGTMDAPPPALEAGPRGGWALWERLAAEHPGFGNPAVFRGPVAETMWMSFAVTLHDTAFFDAMERLTGNTAGTGGIVTFRDSRWLLSVVLYHQPHMAGQPEGVQVFWGYALHPDRIGDFVARPMSACGGADILRELRGHLAFDEAVFARATCIPCRMPYITSQFQPRRAGDRPPPVPDFAHNIGLVSQFVEIDADTVFTVEYSVRAAQMAVYALFGVERPVPPVTAHDKALDAQVAALMKAFR